MCLYFQIPEKETVDPPEEILKNQKEEEPIVAGLQIGDLFKGTAEDHLCKFTIDLLQTLELHFYLK